MIGAILLGLAKANLAAGAAVLAVLAVRKLARVRFGARAAYALWLAPLAAAAAVLLPHPPGAAPISPMVLSARTAMADAAEEFVAQAPAIAQGADIEIAPLLFSLWLVGALAAAGLVLRRQSRFVAAMGRLTPSGAPGVFRAESPDVGPAVVGALWPRIVAPADFETRFAADERRLILAHEEAHLRAGDTTVNALACALQCVSWFNPLVHLGVRILRIDQELACDAAVIGRFPDARRAYAELLLKTQIATQPLPLGCHWPAGADHPLKARIAMLKSPLPADATRAAGVALAVALTLSAGGLAWAAQPAASASPGRAEHAEALKHPDYSCDPALEAKGVGCKVVRTSAWIAMPTPADVEQAYPPGAREAGQTAKVQVTCKTTPRGLLKDCAVQHVNLHVPPGEGAPLSALDDFGNAALQLTRYYQAHIPSLPNAPTKEGSATFFVEIGEFQGAVAPVGDVPPPPSAEGRGQTPASYAPPADFAEPRTNGQSLQPPLHSIWIRKPTGDDLARLYPSEAAAKGLTADVVMACEVGADGRLNNCDLHRVDVTGAHVPDNPADDPGFGAATLELAKLFQMKPVDLRGAPTAGTVIHIPIRFRLPNTATPSAS
jgi:beta-lactamase regulating signal transducer with metallopeptidase domain